ncbi:uncharacterized protein LOC120332539 [Styela clava]
MDLTSQDENCDGYESPSSGSGKDLKNVEEIPSSHELLSDGFMNQILPKIRNIKNKIEEVTKNQNVMIESLQKENEKVEEWNAHNEVSTYMTEVKHYHSKLLKIRKEMVKLSEKSAKLKQRSLKLDQIKQKEDLKQKEIKEKQKQEELSLTAKPATLPPEQS